MTDLDEEGDKERDGEAPAEKGDGGGHSNGASAFLRQDGETAEAYARRIFQRAFQEDIETVLKMEVHEELPSHLWLNLLGSL